MLKFVCRYLSVRVRGSVNKWRWVWSVDRRELCANIVCMPAMPASPIINTTKTKTTLNGFLNWHQFHQHTQEIIPNDNTKAPTPQNIPPACNILLCSSTLVDVLVPSIISTKTTTEYIILRVMYVTRGFVVLPGEPATANAWMDAHPKTSKPYTQVKNSCGRIRKKASSGVRVNPNEK